MSFTSKTVQKITSWSFSRWSVYEECPAKAKYKFIDKLKEPGSAAMDRGTALHKLCENYLKSGGRIHKDIKLIGTTLKDYRKRGALAEADFTFKQDWSATRWDDWNGAWCRIKADVTIPPVVDDEEPTAEVHDFKTGGRLKLENNDFGEYHTQLELYGLAGLLTFPTAKKVVASLVFIDFGKTIEAPEVLYRGDEKKLMKKWEVRTKRMLSDTTFKPKPGNACRWCHFRKSNNGPCQF
jgi:CRISPR/Cas system-associated exonuclease Cas4 (RecB family)